MVQSIIWLRGNPFILVKQVLKKGMDFRCYGTFLIYLFKSILFFPFFLYEYFFLSQQINRTQIKKAPVFIIGHFRSGTTLLHKLLSSDPQFVHFKNTDLVFPGLNFPGATFIKRGLQKVINRLKLPSFAYNNLTFKLDDPQEEDMCMVTSFGQKSYYWMFVFPKHVKDDFPKLVSLEDTNAKTTWQKEYLYYLKKIAHNNNDKTLLLKNPPNTARIKAILELFPDAKFIFLYRNPANVIFSTKRIWLEGLKKFSLQQIDNELIDEIILDIYVKLHSKYEREKSIIPSSNLLEVRYEELEESPMKLIESIYSSFQLDRSGLYKVFEKLKQENCYSKFQYQSDNKLSGKISVRLSKYFDEWSYQF